MSTTIRNIVLGTLIVGLIVALVVVALPFSSVFAAGSVLAAGADVSSIPADISSSDPATTNARLELAFNREKSIINRIGEAVNNFDLVTGNVQKLLDKAKSNGKDVSAIQAAFDTFKAAFQTGKPSYEQANTILGSQTSFDSNGKVIDTEKAKATVKSLRTVLQQYSGTVKTARQALRDAVHNFRLANPHKNATPAPAATNPQN